MCYQNNTSLVYYWELYIWDLKMKVFPPPRPKFKKRIILSLKSG